MANPYVFETGLYDQVRPEYPLAVIEEIKSRAEERTPTEQHPAEIADLGAGTGKMTRMLLRAGLSVEAIEPANSMRESLRQVDSRLLTIREATAESTGLGAASMAGAVFAQSWHWCDPEATSAELRRILLPGAVAHIIYNQLDVSVPWVKRLTRIMRSGDVHRPSQVPAVGSAFSRPKRTDYYWRSLLSREDILALARTRSSYLMASAEQQERMQNNLNWYLSEHLQIPEASLVSLPYITYHWQTQLLPK